MLGESGMLVVCRGFVLMTSSCGRSGAGMRTNPYPSASPLGSLSRGKSPLERVPRHLWSALAFTTTCAAPLSESST